MSAAGRTLDNASLEELDRTWEMVKAREERDTPPAGGAAGAGR